MALNPIFTFGTKALLLLLLHLCIYLRLYIVSGLHQANMLWFSLFSNELIRNEGLKGRRCLIKTMINQWFDQQLLVR